MKSENSKTNKSHYDISVDHNSIDVYDMMIFINI